MVGTVARNVGEGGLGHISEIFDSDAPRRPVGRIPQGWSVTEILRAAVEDIFGILPQKPAVPLDVAQQLGKPKRKRAAS